MLSLAKEDGKVNEKVSEYDNVNTIKGRGYSSSNNNGNSSNNSCSRLNRDIIRYFSKEIRDVLEKVNLQKLECLEEIRLRAGKPLIIQDYANEWLVDYSGNIARSSKNPFIVKQEEILTTLEIMSRNSIYAFQEK